MLVFAGCPSPQGQSGGDGGSSTSGVIDIDGSSTVYPITEAVAEEFGKVNSDVNITVSFSGTGGGFKRFQEGETQISDASRPIKPSEAAECEANGVEYVELPVAYDGIAVVVHSDNDWVDYMTVDELHTLWAPEAEGQVMNWSDVRPGWPDTKIELYGPGTDSGTFDYFTQAINGEEQASRGDFTPSENDDTLVRGVSNSPNALAYFGYAYYAENTDKLKIVPIEDGDDSNGAGPITPSTESIETGLYQPLSRPIFIYVNVSDADSRPEVEAFVQFYLDQAPVLVPEVGYIALPPLVYDMCRDRFDNRILGSVFGGGAQVGVTVEELLASER